MALWLFQPGFVALFTSTFLKEPGERKEDPHLGLPTIRQVVPLIRGTHVCPSRQPPGGHRGPEPFPSVLFLTCSAGIYSEADCVPSPMLGSVKGTDLPWGAPPAGGR